MGVTFTPLNWSVQLEPPGGGGAIDVTDTVISVSISLGIGQQAAATVNFRTWPTGINQNVPIYIYGQLGAGTPPILFNGFVDDTDYGLDEESLTVVCTDWLSRLTEAWTREVRTYTSEDSSAVVQNLVEASGVDVSLTDIQAPSGWTLGVAEPVTLELGDVPLDLIRKIDEAEPLWTTFTASNGAVTRRPIALGTSVATYSFGSAPLLGGSMRYSLRDIYNAARVTGAVYNGVPVEEVYQASSSFIPNPPQYRTFALNSYLIEDPTRAATVAQALVDNYHNSNRALATLRCTLHQRDPAETITIDTWEDVFVTRVTHTIGNGQATTEIEAIGLP